MLESKKYNIKICIFCIPTRLCISLIQKKDECLRKNTSLM